MNTFLLWDEVPQPPKTGTYTSRLASSAQLEKCWSIPDGFETYKKYGLPRCHYEADDILPKAVIRAEWMAFWMLVEDYISSIKARRVDVAPTGYYLVHTDYETVFLTKSQFLWITQRVLSEEIGGQTGIDELRQLPSGSEISRKLARFLPGFKKRQVIADAATPWQDLPAHRRKQAWEYLLIHFTQGSVMSPEDYANWYVKWLTINWDSLAPFQQVEAHAFLVSKTLAEQLGPAYAELQSQIDELADQVSRTRSLAGFAAYRSNSGD